MPKLAALLVVAAAVVGVAAQTASADVPNPSYYTINYGPSKEFKCVTPLSPGVNGQYGAWGDYIDGCTVRLSCPTTSARCTAWEGTSIDAYGSPAARVTQNARIRTINSFTNAVIGWSDRSCSGTASCGISDRALLFGGQSASVQCNGVRQHFIGAPWASNTCSIRMDYEGWPPS
jgi:hypothetical protein